MSKTWLIIIILIPLVITLIYFLFPRKTDIISLQIKDRHFNLEIAQTVSQRVKGLMNRDSLCPDCGMIFIFENQMPLSFWMKNTHIPLDIIFLDASGKVINIGNGIPQSLDQINSLSPAKYVIELNAGTSQKIGLKSGDLISLPW